MTNFIYAVIAVFVFFCSIALVEINEAHAEIDRLKEVKLMDCKFSKGAHAHTWKNACMIKNGVVEIL